jgi:heptosyltransferase-2
MPAHYARLMTRLIRERGAQVVLVGSRADAAATACIGGLVDPDPGSAVIDLAGDTTLETLAGVLRLASVCVSNDSGAMHVAAAIGVPVVALFGPTREWETAPLPRQGARAEVLVNPVWCRPCMLRECPIDHRCMKGLSPERVFPVVTELMAGTR